MRKPAPLLAVTMGDPAGVGPELCLRLLATYRLDADLAAACRLVVVGDAGVLGRVAEAAAIPVDVPVVSGWADATGPAQLLDMAAMRADAVVPGRVSAACGEAAFRYCTAAIDAATAGGVQGVVTGPINKEALQAAGHRYPGHTELFAERFGVERCCMLQIADDIACSFVTTHVGYADVPSLLTSARILDVLELTHAALVRIRGHAPRLLVCGLNPHAGEHGLFGQGEEERIIGPAVEAACRGGIDAVGPIPGDTAFTPQARAGYDGVVCMYHDQGHIPVKMIAFDRAVNVTLGLPVPRTSVDHGTAFDIAWQGLADPGSLIAAVRLAARLAAAAEPA